MKRNNGKPPLIYDVVYPPDLIDEIKYKGKCDAKRLAEEGMVIIFDSVLPKGKSTKENLSQIPQMFCTSGYPCILFDIDNYLSEAEDAAKFIQTTGVIGDFPLWLFRNTFLICELFSKKKDVEINKEDNLNSKLWAKYIQVNFDEDNDDGLEYYYVVVSTHKYLIEGIYLDNLLELHQRRMYDVTHGGLKSKNNKKKNMRTPFTKSIRHEVFKRDDYKCVECGASKEQRCLHVDHIIPVSRGGTDELDNLQTLCDGCNLAKKNRIINRSKRGKKRV